MANANYLIQGSTMTAIANAIRAKTGGSSPIDGEDMATEIASISGGYQTKIDGVVQNRNVDLVSDNIRVSEIEATIFNLHGTTSSVSWIYNFFKTIADSSGAYRFMRNLPVGNNGSATRVSFVIDKFMGNSGISQFIPVGTGRNAGFNGTTAANRYILAKSLHNMIKLNGVLYTFDKLSLYVRAVDIATGTGSNVVHVTNDTVDDPVAPFLFNKILASGSALSSGLKGYWLCEDGTFVLFDPTDSANNYFTQLATFDLATLDSGNYSRTPMCVVGNDAYIFTNGNIYKYTYSTNTWSLFYQPSSGADSPVATTLERTQSDSEAFQIYMPKNLIGADISHQYLGLVGPNNIWWIACDYQNVVRTPYRKDTLVAGVNFALNDTGDSDPVFSLGDNDYYQAINGYLYKTPDGLSSTDLSAPSIVCKNYIEGVYTP